MDPSTSIRLAEAIAVVCGVAIPAGSILVAILYAALKRAPRRTPPGAGGLIGTGYSQAGATLEKFINKTTHRFGIALGPNAVARKIQKQFETCSALSVLTELYDFLHTDFTAKTRPVARSVAIRTVPKEPLPSL